MKSMLNRRQKLINLALCFFLIACASATAQAQEVVYDWAGKKLLSYPTQVNQVTTVNVVITNVNDILYEYRITVIAIPRPIDDWANLAGLLTRGSRSLAPSRAGGCSTLIQEAIALMTGIHSRMIADPALPFKIKANGPPYPSVPLQQTLDAWGRLRGDIASLRDKAQRIEACTPDQDVLNFRAQYLELNAAIERIESKINSPHEARATAVLRPENNYKVVVEELFDSAKTKEGERTFEFSPASNVLTLTVGALFSRIQDRSYEARKFPDSTQNVLVTEGNSRLRPEGVALLNYILPYADSDTIGLALSAGPAIRFGSKSDLSTLGFFTGPSVHLYRRFYFTSGVHIGEFADFPIGFRENSPVPANFGELKPVKRWTGRFAFSISFRTASFGNLVKAEAPKVTDSAPK